MEHRQDDDEYLADVAGTVAAAISRGYSMEIAYQPSKELFMGLIFTPLWNIVTGPGRDGLRNSCPGMEYTWGVTMVSYVGVSSYPYAFFRLEDDPDLENDYVTECWKTSTQEEADALVRLFDEITEGMALP